MPNPFVEAQARGLVEGLRLLEVYVTAPLGLNADVRMMRESLGLPYAGDLGREDGAALRRAHAALAAGADDRSASPWRWRAVGAVFFYSTKRRTESTTGYSAISGKWSC